MNVKLVETTSGDYEEYYKIRSTPGDVYWNGYSAPPDKEQFKKIFLDRTCEQKFDKVGDRRIYFINYQDTIVGFVQLIKRVNKIEIGYTVKEEYQGLGIATKAVNLALPIALTYAPMLSIRVRDDNIASQKVALKNRFVRTDNYEMLHTAKSGDVVLREYLKVKGD